MRVLVAHNRYRSGSPSGENVVVDAEISLLRDAGVEVVPYLRSSDEIESFRLRQRVALAFGPIYSRRGVLDVEALIAKTRPHVLHLHNPNPLISPAVINTAQQRGVSVVQTVHNHRHVCLNGIHYREERVCRDCVGRRMAWPGVLHACYRDSRAQSTVLATANAIHRNTYLKVDRFLALTPTLARHLQGIGVPESKITVRPNTVEDPGASPGLGDSRQLLFAGRLRAEKGPLLLLEAWRRRHSDAFRRLVIVGDGPQRSEVERLAATAGDVDVLGPTTPSGVIDHIARSAAVAIPSTCPEAFPRVAVESMAVGRAVLATNLGGLASIVRPNVGVTSDPIASSLATAIDELGSRDLQALGLSARREYEAAYHPRVVTKQLISVYEELRATS